MAGDPIKSGTLEGFPNPPAMMRGEQSSPAPHAPKELVDRAYQVGAAATAVAAAAPAVADAAPPWFVDRRGLIRALGIVQIVLGAICGVLTLAALGLSGGKPVLGLGVYAVATANFLTTGIGSVRLARWARRATVISAGVWLPVMVVAIVAFWRALQITLGAADGDYSPDLTIFYLAALIAVGAPFGLLMAYTRPSVRETFERRQAS
ncbi:MAG TPA: hypothetical protein VN903_32515 [Polyangia bacterium]|nr:hypothetical protein [Polyangia bacterium]